MKKSSAQRPNRNLERILKWVIVILILMNLLLFLPRHIPNIRLDLIHPSLPSISLEALRLDNLPIIRDLVREARSLTSGRVLIQNSNMTHPSITSTEVTIAAVLDKATPTSPTLPITSPVNTMTVTPTNIGTSTITANGTSTITATPSSIVTSTVTPIGTSVPTARTSLTPSPTQLAPSATVGSIKMYYVAPNGDDSNPGTIEEPWHTLAPVHARDFLPGDVIHFKRGGTWSGGLVINDSGVEDNPITFKAYGTGDKPVFTNPGGAGSDTRVIRIDADWVVVEDFLVQDANEAGVYISNGSNYNIVRDIEATNVGVGIAIHGKYNLTTRNHIHDLHMVVNTQGGDDDWGAVGIWLFNSNNEVSYNRIENCKALSYDYGYDGGVFEFNGYANNNLFHHNWGEASNLVFEIAGGSAKNNIVSYNVFLNNMGLGAIHLQGKFASEVENFRFENNVVVDIAHDELEYAMIWWNGNPSESTFIIRNNIFYVGNFWFFTSTSGFTHDHNLYYLINGNTRMSDQGNYSLGTGEMIDDPLFVDITNKDFHLQASSPAIDSGMNLGYSLDFDDRLVPFGVAPDIGSFEYRP